MLIFVDFYFYWWLCYFDMFDDFIDIYDDIGYFDDDFMMIFDFYDDFFYFLM